MAVREITKENFEELVLNAEGTVLVDFWAPWCGPCKMLGPVIEDISEERGDVLVGKINVDEQQELASKYGVMSIPTLIVFKAGEVSDKSIGVKQKADILEML